MTKILIISVSLLCIFSSSKFVCADDVFNYGKAWEQSSKDNKLAWVWGFANGQEVVFEELRVHDYNKSIECFVSYKDADVIRDIMSQYYADASNAFIPWKYMAHVAKMKLDGQSTEQINKELESLRSYASWVKRLKKE